MEKKGIAAMNVYADLRWPATTGIGNVMTAVLDRKPASLALHDLVVPGRIGSPFSPWAITRALRKLDSADGVFWSAGFVPPAFAEIPAVITVHDLTHLHFYTRLHKAYYDFFFKPLYRRCHRIVCCSAYTRNEFLQWSGMAAEKVHVVYNGVGQAYLDNTEILGRPYRYVLYPGNHRSYKNLDRLVAAYAASSLPQQDIHLVLTGNENQALVAQARALGLERYLHFIGRVPEADLPKVYKGALLVAFVSLYEGFGLPIVEAMASGVPVLTSGVSSMPEVAGNAALIVDPYSVEAITSGLNQLAGDAALRSELIERGRLRVKDFDWDRSAKQLWDIVESARQRG